MNGPLVDVAWLAGALSQPQRPVLLDVRWRLGGPAGIGSYRVGHLPGAVFVDLDNDLSGEPGRNGRHPLPEAGSFQAAMRRAGVSPRATVVVYDEADAMAAARGWWLLRYFGHAQVYVLDGGYRAWVAAGGQVATGESSPPGPGEFTASPGHMPLLDATGAAALARQGLLLDARAAERYRGEVEPVDPVAGHIPGALSAPATGNLTANGRFLPPAELRARFAALGLAGAGPAGAGPVGGRSAVSAGAYCGSGVTAAHEVLALAAAGIPAALYVGSWSHWVTDPGRPVASGPAPV